MMMTATMMATLATVMIILCVAPEDDMLLCSDTVGLSFFYVILDGIF
jgi:uncharacterized membrane protein YeiH